MTEDEISLEMYQVAQREAEMQVLSWQGVGGKSYLTRSVRLIAGTKIYLPDLVILNRADLWIIEIKGTHEESLFEDEPKLANLRASLSDLEIRAQVHRAAKVSIEDFVEIRSAVAYSVGGPEDGCDPTIRHIPWVEIRPDIAQALR